MIHALAKYARNLLLTLAVCLLLGPDVLAQRGWISQPVDLQAGSGRRIKSIRYPVNRRPRLRRDNPGQESGPAGSSLLNTTLKSWTGATTAVSAAPMEVIDPPVDGFIPWIAVAVTREREDDLVLDAVVESSLRGSVPSGVHLATDYGIGIFDTGASAHVMGYATARQLGLYGGGLLTANETVISGVVGEVMASVSMPLGIFIDGLGAVDANTAQLDTAYMRGESNVAIMVGQPPLSGYPDLPTAIGPPLSVYYTTLIRNSTPVQVTRGDRVYSGPDVLLYDRDDDSAPRFDNVIPLELRPLGAVSVQYIPTVDMGLGGLGGGLDDLLDGLGGLGGSSDFPPSTPSIIVGNSSQSLFFVHSVDLYEDAHQALDKNRFMLDTGAQVTVIGNRIAARLGLNPADAEFKVEIEGVTGQSLMAPGFTLDRLEIPALGQWFTAVNVPVVLLNVSSPEGGTLDGIIGMNLFTEFNLVIRGGGFALDDDPSLELQRIGVASDPNQL